MSFSITVEPGKHSPGVFCSSHLRPRTNTKYTKHILVVEPSVVNPNQHFLTLHCSDTKHMISGGFLTWQCPVTAVDWKTLNCFFRTVTSTCKILEWHKKVQISNLDQGCKKNVKFIKIYNDNIQHYINQWTSIKPIETSVKYQTYAGKLWLQKSRLSRVIKRSQSSWGWLTGH